MLTEGNPNNALNTKRERKKQILRLQHLNKEEQKLINAICEDFNEMFFFNENHLTHTNAVQYRITMRTNTSPVNVKLY